MRLTRYNKENLLSTRLLIDTLNDQTYREPIDILSGATVGQHVRHILEFYVCLFRERRGRICYDERERNHRIETVRSFALAVVDDLILKLNRIAEDKSIYLKANYSANGTDETLLASSLFRELAYCLDHSIHHQALIKVAIKSLSVELLLDNDFGVAPSTTRHSAEVTECNSFSIDLGR